MNWLPNLSAGDLVLIKIRLGIKKPTIGLILNNPFPENPSSFYSVIINNEIYAFYYSELEKL